MIPLLSSIRKNGITSPYGPVFFACALFLVAWLFPPATYTQYMQEPDRMFLDPLTAIYFFLCAGAFVFGLRVQRSLNPAAWRQSLPSLRSASPVLYLGLPLVAAILFAGAYLRVTGQRLNVVALLLAHQGEDLKTAQAAGVALAAGGIWGFSSPLLTAVLWWSLLRLRQLRLGLSVRLPFVILWLAGLFVGIVTSVSLVDRTSLMTMIAGCVLIFVFGRESEGHLGITRIAFYCSAAFSIVLGFFVALSLLRGNASNANFLIGNLLTYSISPYNRLASLLHGEMFYLYGGRGIYLFRYLQEGGNTINKIFGFHAALNWPSALVVFHSEFSSVMLAGLNSRAIWSGVFGYLYADLGWGAPIYVFFVGIFAGYVWSRFARGPAMAVTLYPWIVVWILFWHGSNVLFNLEFLELIYVGILLAGWDRFSSVAAISPEMGKAEKGLAPGSVNPAST